MSEINATIGVAGDPDVGIPSATWELTGGFIFDDAMHRNDVRDILADAFYEITGEPATVVFSDEILPEPTALAEDK